MLVSHTGIIAGANGRWVIGGSGRSLVRGHGIVGVLSSMTVEGWLFCVRQTHEVYVQHATDRDKESVNGRWS